VITCPSCSKANQDHYRFCLGCGAELPRGGGAAQAKGAEPVAIIEDEPTQIGPIGAILKGKGGSAALGATVAFENRKDEGAAEVVLPPGMCPECQFVNPPTNRFCASCGFKLDVKKAATAPAAKPKAVGEGSGAILVALDPEGNETGRHELARGESMIGRDSGGPFAGDAFLSPKHAVFVSKDGRVTVRDNGSLNGVFRKLLAEQRAPLGKGQMFRIGQELLLFEPLDARQPGGDGVSHLGTNVDGYIGRLSLVVGRKTRAPSMPVPAHGLNLGRERGDVLFAEDGYVSGLHCSLTCENGTMYVTDLGSSNGTFIQLTGETELKNGDVLLMGQQLFRVTL
jgi:pSer/pThr/pTyr-binding forkhead associated (FHA) protein